MKSEEYKPAYCLLCASNECEHSRYGYREQLNKIIMLQEMEKYRVMQYFQNIKKPNKLLLLLR